MDTNFGESDQETFFIKNSQNIQKNLAQVIKNNEDEICNVWLRRLLENWSETTLLLKEKHLKSILLPGLRDFISSSQNILFLSNALNLLAKEFEEYIQANNEQSNTEAQKLLAKQIQTAIYYFQDAIDSILKIQNIPPHWIFALDSLIRSTVQQAVNLLFQNFKHLFNIDDIDSVNTDTNITGTIYNRQNSCMTSISHPSFEEEILLSRQIKEHFKTELKQLIQENQKTVKTLSDTFAEYLQEQNQLFRHLCEQVSSAKTLLTNNNSVSYNQTCVVSSMRGDDSPKIGDVPMISFLHNENICQSTIDTVSWWIYNNFDKKK